MTALRLISATSAFRKKVRITMRDADSGNLLSPLIAGSDIICHRSNAHALRP
jgi:hypothetical protein